MFISNAKFTKVGVSMYLKTTSSNQSDYFKALSATTLQQARKQNRRIQIHKSDSELFFKFNQTVRLTADQGLALVVMTQTPDDFESYQKFMLTNSIDLVPGIYFNTLAITESCSIYMEPLGPGKPETVPTVQKISARKYKTQLHLNDLHAIFYQIKMAPYESYSIPGDYYELIIVDQGELIHTVDNEDFVARKNDCFIYPPNQIRLQRIEKESVTSYLSILFSATGLTHSVVNQIITLGSQNSQLIERIIELANVNASQNYIDDELLLYVKTILLKIVQGETSSSDKPTTSMRENYENELFQAMVEFIEKNVEEHNQVSDLVDHFSLSRSTIQSLFNKYVNTTPKDYMNKVRLNRSKKMIRETQLTLSQIADKLGYGSIQYFSRAFSREFGMSPSNYAKSILK